MKLSILHTATLLTAVHQAAAQVNASYDDLAPALTVGVAVGTYEDLTYNSAWDYGTQLTVAIGGVKSQSSPNRILTSGLTQASGNTPSITVATGTPYTSYSPIDFYFGCALSAGQNLATQATECTITVAGFVKGNDQEVALASYTFTPPAVAAAPVPMLHAVLPASFEQKLVNVTMIQTDPAVNVLLVDNWRYYLNK